MEPTRPPNISQHRLFDPPKSGDAFSVIPDIFQAYSAQVDEEEHGDAFCHTGSPFWQHTPREINERPGNHVVLSIQGLVLNPRMAPCLWTGGRVMVQEVKPVAFAVPPGVWLYTLSDLGLGMV